MNRMPLDSTKKGGAVSIFLDASDSFQKQWDYAARIRRNSSGQTYEWKNFFLSSRDHVNSCLIFDSSEALRPLFYEICPTVGAVFSMKCVYFFDRKMLWSQKLPIMALHSRAPFLFFSLPSIPGASQTTQTALLDLSFTFLIIF